MPPGSVQGGLWEAVGGFRELPGVSREAPEASHPKTDDSGTNLQIFEVRLGAKKLHFQHRKQRNIGFQEEVCKRCVLHTILEAILDRFANRI